MKGNKKFINNKFYKERGEDKVEKRQVILASHGEFSKGLKYSLKMILGELAEDVRTYSLYPGEIASDFSEELGKEIRDNSDTEYVILTDVFGGSVCNALMTLTVCENVKLFAGMNFNMAAEVLTQSVPLTEKAVEEILETAKEGVQYVVLNREEEEEDF